MLREETVEPATLELLRKIVSLPELKQFRLVGGTALSLLYGHRKSIDLDFFSDRPLEKDILVETLEDNFGRINTVNDRTKSIYQCIIQDVKVDFVSVRDPFLNPIQFIDNIPFADTKDLIALKLNAVKGRGVKKDFWDIAKLLEFYTFENLFQFYHDRYTYDDTFAVIRSVIYFADAENTISPESLDGMTWDKVKTTIVKAFDDYYRNIRN
ncbi:nucleotidyl transferase AbiEii/AbiGii toxin family protein [Mucilaginibacter sp. AW1-7]|jgi:predicted nucleotidyltransferase component of viral defense system|uniref:nucleotidyl transferase AbiEii/AbiGii toxin family protein n=1 Tax=unclassified Mucilaginibacter TaxID=2617802 RepID=UPI002365DFC8|nr:nucleotidyl transferase AbiEii/AbiGii toxin family protein [Mucilaginibacter sp. KACC 22773]WDF76374.1 nucleotidyl transferase AbiEii/AbiGii toxin family protein [Mucilaginibacter sp. KACC 22773]